MVVVVTLITFIVLMTLGVFGLLAGGAPKASAAPVCNAALCMYSDANYSGSTLTAARGVSGDYPNLKEKGFNDAMSSMNNMVNHTQVFYSDANGDGYRGYLPPYAYAPDLANIARTQSIFGNLISWNDVISSVYWIG